MQKNHRSSKAEILTIGFGVYRLSPREAKKEKQGKCFFEENEAIAVSPFFDMYEVTSRISLGLGDYMIALSTFDPDEEGEFFLRILFQQEEDQHGEEEEENDDDDD